MSTDLQRGADIARYYKDLIDYPPSLVPYNTQSLHVLIERCKKGLSPEDAFIIGSLAGPLSSKGWEIVKQGCFYFPEDNGPHYNTRKEWWYLACNFNIPGHDKPMSILMIFTRAGTVPPYMRRGGQDGKDAQVVFIQTYVTIPSKNEHYSFRYHTSGDSVTMESNPFELSIDKTEEPSFSMNSISRDSVFPMNVTIKDTGSKMDIYLNLNTSNKPDWFPQGNNGCAPCISGMGYRYYSMPNISVQGNVKVGSNDFVQLKGGSAWFDHQWGARMNPLGYPTNYYLRALSNISQYFSNPQRNIRWNWFCLHLDNDTEITTALIPAPEQNNKGPFDLTNTTLLDSKIKKLQRKDLQDGQVRYTGFATSPTGTTYPLGWELNFPNEDIKLTLTPSIDNQFGYSGDNSEFMGAGVVIVGTKDGKKISGSGFVECMSYESDHDFITNSLQSLDYTTDKLSSIIEDFYPMKPGGGLFALSLLIVFLPVMLIILIVVFMILIIQMNTVRSAR